MGLTRRPPELKPRFGLAALIAAAGILLIAGLPQLELPGLNYDEALDVVPAMQFIQGQNVDSLATFTFAGRQWPLMIMPYMGPVLTYAMMPVLVVAGANMVALRGFALLIALIGLVLSWGFLRSTLDERVAGLAVLLMAANASYVFWARMLAKVHFLLMPISVLFLWSLFAWHRHARGRYLVLAAFLLGIGLTTHPVFIWLCTGLLAGWVVLSPTLGSGYGWRRWLWPLRRTRLSVWLFSFGGLLLGCLPLIVYNLQNQGSIGFARQLAATEVVEGTGGLSGLLSLPRLALSAFISFLDSDSFGPNLGAWHSNHLAAPAFLLALAVVAWLMYRRQLGYSVRRVALLMIVLVLVVLQNGLIPSTLSPYHLLMLWPIPQALIATAIWRSVDLLRAGLPRHIGKRRHGPGAPTVVLAATALCLIGAEAWTTFRYHRTLAATGGVGHSSEAVYRLAADLDRPGAPAVVSMDWGFRRSLQFLTEGRIDAAERFTYESPSAEEYADALDLLLRKSPDALYLFHSPSYTAFPGQWEVFEETAYSQRLTPMLWRTYTQLDGKPIYLVYQLTPAAHLFERPKTALPVNADLGDGLALIGYELATDRVRVGQSIELSLYWQASKPQTRNTKVFVHLLDDSGKLVSQHDSPPVQGAYPMTEWRIGEVIWDRVKLKTGPEALPGRYHLFVGVYDSSTGQRLPLFVHEQRLQGDTLGLVDVTLE